MMSRSESPKYPHLRFRSIKLIIKGYLFKGFNVWFPFLFLVGKVHVQKIKHMLLLLDPQM